MATVITPFRPRIDWHVRRGGSVFPYAYNMWRVSPIPIKVRTKPSLDSFTLSSAVFRVSQHGKVSARTPDLLSRLYGCTPRPDPPDPKVQLTPEVSGFGLYTHTRTCHYVTEQSPLRRAPIGSLLSGAIKDGEDFCLVPTLITN